MRDYARLEYPGTHHKLYLQTLIPWIIRRFRLERYSTLLDIGCGLGDAVGIFWKNCIIANGIDSREPSIAHCFRGDIEKKLMLPINYFDAVFCKSVIEHLHNPSAMVEEVYRLLRPGGKFIVLTPDWRYCYRHFYADCTHIRPFTMDSLAQLLRLCGFNNVTKETIRPSIHWLRYPRWRWLIALITLLPYRWLGELKFSARPHIMALVCGTKGETE